MVDLGWHWMSFFVMMWNIIFWVAVIALAVWVIRRLTRGGTPPSRSDRQTPEVIVRTRYARGEINREQYEELVKELRT